MMIAVILSLVLVMLLVVQGTLLDAQVEAGTKKFHDRHNHSKGISDRNSTRVIKESNKFATKKSQFKTQNSVLAQTVNKTLPKFCTATNRSLFTPEFIACPLITINSKEYEKFDNGSVYVSSYSMAFNESTYSMDSMCNLHICIAFFGINPEPEKFSKTIAIISNVCTGISSICIILHMLTFIFIESMRHLPGCCLFSLSVALLAAYLCAFIQFNVDNLEGCVFNGMFMLYFFLAAFFWMNTIAFDVWRSIRAATTAFRSTLNRPLGTQFVLYSLYSWGAPLAIIISAVIVHYSTSEPEYKLIFEKRFCWFLHKTPLTLYFVAPVFTLLGVNILLFASSYYMMCIYSFTDHESQKKSDLKRRFYFWLKLGSVTGLTWIFGCIATATNVQVIWYLFAILCSLQGAFISISFALKKKEREKYKNLLLKTSFFASSSKTFGTQDKFDFKKSFSKIILFKNVEVV